MKLTKQINIGGVPVGGGAPIAIQSMTNTDTRDAKATLAQIRALAEAGCDIVRCAVPDMNGGGGAARDLRRLAHSGRGGYPFRLPSGACRHRGGCGQDPPEPRQHRRRGPRAGGREGLQRQRHLPIRIGVNSGSVEKHILEKFGGPTPEAHGRERAVSTSSC